MLLKKVATALMGTALGFTLLFTACRREEAVTAQQAGKYEINFTPAKTNGELAALRNDPNANLIRTLAQFDGLVADRLTPLSKLSPEVVADFRSEIVVREGVGVVGLKYHLLRKKLSPSDFHEIMALFGLDTKNGFWGGASANSARRTNMAEYSVGYRCERGACFRDPYSICIEGC